MSKISLNEGAEALRWWFKRMYYRASVYDLGVSMAEYMEDPMKYLNVMQWVQQTGGLTR